MDERDLPKAPLNLFHILDVSTSATTGGRREDGGTASRKELGRNAKNFKFVTSTKFNHGSIHVIDATLPDADGTWFITHALCSVRLSKAFVEVAHVP